MTKYLANGFFYLSQTEDWINEQCSNGWELASFQTTSRFVDEQGERLYFLALLKRETDARGTIESFASGLAMKIQRLESQMSDIAARLDELVADMAGAETDAVIPTPAEFWHPTQLMQQLSGDARRLALIADELIQDDLKAAQP